MVKSLLTDNLVDNMEGIFDKSLLLKKRPPGLHKTNSNNTTNNSIEDMIEKSKCSKEYFLLEDCLGEHDRNWSKCQDLVKILKVCNNNNNANQNSN